MESILGQQRAIHVLQQALEAQRLHHAWIFAGPPGVGKFTTAVAFARYLLSSGKDGQNAEVDAETARLVDAGSHPDLHIIRKELARYSDDNDIRRRKLTNIPLDVLRQYMIGGMVGTSYFEPVVSHTPVMAGSKVFVIDEAELLDQQGQNSMLKTLEEPPADTYLILITSRPQRLLPTIRSRCQLVRFDRLDDDAMSQWFAQAGLELDEQQRQWIEWFAEGSPGTAQLATQFKFYQWQQTLQPMLDALAAGTYPPDMGSTLGELVDSFAVAYAKADANRSKDAANKDGCRHILQLLGSFCRRQMQLMCARGEQPNRWLTIVDALREAEAQIFANVNYKLVLENLVAQWAEAREPAHAS